MDCSPMCIAAVLAQHAPVLSPYSTDILINTLAFLFGYFLKPRGMPWPSFFLCALISFIVFCAIVDPPYDGWSIILFACFTAGSILSSLQERQSKTAARQ